MGDPIADTPEKLVAGVLAAEPRAVSRAIDLVEDQRAERGGAQRELLAALEAATPADHAVIGLTGPPGAGKSSLAARLIHHWNAAGKGIGMVAVDPSSRRSGGALLGDRTRIRLEPGARAFVRSMAARDQLGGLAPATRAAVVVLRAAFEGVLVETVGVGQSEIDVETVADVVALVLQPSSGDTLQFMKAGILEIPDVLVVHKWDLGPHAERTRADLEAMLALQPTPAAGLEPVVIGASAETGFGVDALADALCARVEALSSSGELGRRRGRSRVAWVVEIVARTFGEVGIRRLGGRAALERAAAAEPGPALAAASSLASRAGLEA